MNMVGRNALNWPPAGKAAASDALRAGAQDIELVLVDDEADLVAEIAEYLSLNGLECWHTTSSASALAHVQSVERPCVVLSDLRMPGIAGIDLVKQLHQGGKPKALEVILFSGFADMDQAIDALQLGVMDFLVKPFDLDQLRRAIDRAFVRIREKERERQHDAKVGAQLAETLAKAQQLTSSIQTAAASLTVTQSSSDRPAAPAVTEGAQVNEALLLRSIKLLQAIRRQRDKIFPICADDDATWEIILFVLEQHILGRPVPVTSACHATIVPQTTAMRRIDALVANKMLIRVPDETDRRRILVLPTENCRNKCQKFLMWMFEQIKRFSTDLAEV